MKKIKYGDLFILLTIVGLFVWKVVPWLINCYNVSKELREVLGFLKWMFIILYTTICFATEYLRNSRYYVLKWNLLSLIIHFIDDTITPFIKNKNKNNEKS